MPQPYEHLLHSSEKLHITEVAGGHMSYERLLINSDEHGLQFAKLHNASLFTDPVRERHSREYLVKEQAMLSHLRAQDFAHVPSHSRLVDDHSLVMEGLPPEDGWYWRAPTEESERYTTDILAVLDELEHIEHPTHFFNSHAPAREAFIEEGWQSLDTHRFHLVGLTLQRLQAHLHPHMQPAAQELAHQLPRLRVTPLPLDAASSFCHHDLRQANVAWHPDHGVRLVDWSWADAGLEKADQTSLLIDLHKSGHDVKRYLATHFNPDHAHVLLGFLLARSIAPACGSESEVRFHQAVSAVSAFDLLRAQENL